jgi:uncharacterized protein (TIGR02466 family)
MPVELWFPVPFLIHDVEPPARDAIRAKVMAYLETEDGKRDVAPAPSESVATSYYKPERSVLVDAKLTELEEVIIRAGNTFIESLALPPRRLEIERAWINVFRPGAQEALHSHDGSLLSCSYYVEAPEQCGDLAFPDPIGPRRSYRGFTQTTGDNFLTLHEMTFKPQAGRLIMFESWIQHGVHCNKSDRNRISLAFNLRQAR